MDAPFVSPFVSPFVCANCGAPDDPIPGGAKLKSCSVCKVVRYCRRECQVEHWKEHKPDQGGGHAPHHGGPVLQY